MTFLSPLVRRELIVQGRYWGNYWMRVVVGLAGILALAGFWLFERYGDTRGAMPQEVVKAFALVIPHGSVLFVLSLFGALITSDVLPRERREGTLGLLFLTPLKPKDIALGKCGAQLLRLASIWLASLPFLSVPFLMGGITPRNWADAILAQLTAGCLGASAGFLASACCQQWRWAMTSAILWVIAQYVLCAVLAGCVFFWHTIYIGKLSWDWEMLSAIPFLPLMITMGLPIEGSITSIGGAIFGGIVPAGRWALITIGIFEALLLFASVTLSAGVLKRARSKEEKAIRESNPTVPASPRRLREVPQIWWQRLVRKGGSERELLDSNPILWKEWAAGSGWLLSRLIVSAVLVSWMGIIVLSLVDDWEWVWAGWFLLPLLALLAVFMAAASLRQEHEEGALELLLCTGLEPAQLLSGRLWAIIKVVGPPFALASTLCTLFRTKAYQYNSPTNGGYWMGGGIYWGWGWLGLSVAFLIWLYVRWKRPVGTLAKYLVFIVWTASISFLAFSAQGIIDKDGMLLPTLDRVWKERTNWLVTTWFSASLGATSVCVAIRCAIRRVYPLLGFVIALLLGVGLPVSAGFITSLGVAGIEWRILGLNIDPSDVIDTFVIFVFQAFIIVVSLRIARRDLNSREFQLRPLERNRIVKNANDPSFVNSEEESRE